MSITKFCGTCEYLDDGGCSKWGVFLEHEAEPVRYKDCLLHDEMLIVACKHIKDDAVKIKQDMLNNIKQGTKTLLAEQVFNVSLERCITSGYFDLQDTDPRVAYLRGLASALATMSNN